MKFLKNRIHRLQDLKHQRPELVEIFVFYETLFRFFEGETTPFLSLVPHGEDVLLRQRQGFPVLSGSSLAVDEERATDFLVRLIGVLKQSGGQGLNELEALEESLEGGELPVAELFRATLDRDIRRLREAAHALEASPAVVEYVFDTALAFALQRAREEEPFETTIDWREGFCPFCGGVPCMGQLTSEEGLRLLHCPVCALSWTFPLVRCPACGNTDPDALEYFTAEADPEHRVDVCRACSFYLKMVDTPHAPEQIPMDLEDVSTMHLDLLAQKEGFTRGKKGAHF